MLLSAVLAALALLWPPPAESQAKTTIGAVEEVLLLPWGVVLPARVDTGAARSSLDARDIRIVENQVEFRLPRRHGGRRLRLPIYELAEFRTSEGMDVRPVVELEFCLGARRVRTHVSLNDRTKMTYPLLLGRSLLSGGYLVDVSHSQLLKPQCKERNP